MKLILAFEEPDVLMFRKEFKKTTYHSTTLVYYEILDYVEDIGPTFFSSGLYNAHVLCS